MKVNTQKRPTVRPFPERMTRESNPLAMRERKDSEQHKAFIRELNEFVAKAGLLSDDPFFGGI